jgi:2'-5' RNA ligase
MFGRRTDLEEKRVYVLAQYDPDTQRRLNDLYQVLINHGFIGTQTKGIPYHITLGTFGVEDEAEVVMRAQAAAGAADAFTLRLAYLGLFGLNVLFVAPAVKRELLDLRNAVAPGGESEDGFPWVAHTTLLMDEPEAVQRAVPVAAKHFTPFRATVESVGVYEFFPERRIGEYPLRA